MGTETVIIVAGGKGLRMGMYLPKQFIALKGLPILMHTLKSFYTYNPSIEIILVLPLSHQEYWKELVIQYQFNIPHTIANGGDNRFQSVKNGLKMVRNKGLVAVHDGVRPFVSKTMLERCFNEAKLHKAIVPSIPVKDSVREVCGSENKIIDRSKLRLIQTPQIFDFEILQKAYQTPYMDFFTDDASVVEYNGINICLVEGEDYNIKITTPFDLVIGENIIGSFEK